MRQLIEKLNLPWKDKPKRGAFLRVIAALGDILSSDISRVNRAFYPFLCPQELLRSHGEAMGMPYLKGEKDYRKRLSLAGKFLSRAGERGLVEEILKEGVPGRWEIFEAPRMSFRVGFSPLGQSMIARGNFLIIRVKDISPSEKKNLMLLLDSILDPDIEVTILPKFDEMPQGLSLEKIRFYGGGRFLEPFFSGAIVRLLPDDAFRIACSPLGLSPVWEKGAPAVWIWPGKEDPHRLRAKAEIIFSEDVNWQIFSI